MNGVSIAQLIDVTMHQHVSVPAELGGCIVLAAADQLVSMPLELEPSHLMLFEDGVLRLSGGEQTDASTAENRLRELLGCLLRGTAAVTPALLRASQRSAIGDMRAFVRELEIALVPTNRGAAKRALARLCRDVSREIQNHPVINRDGGADLSGLAAVPRQVTQEIEVIVESSSALSDEVPDIPDLEVPNSIVQGLEDCNDVVERPECANSFWAYLPTETTESDPDYFELSDVDLLDDVESVQCPRAALAIERSPELGLDTDVATGAPHETTEPFLLMRVAKVAESGPNDSVRVPRSHCSSSRHALLQFGPKVLNRTVLDLATLERADDSTSPCPKLETTDPLPSDVEPPVGQKMSSAQKTSSTSTEPSSEVRVPLSGPHQFIARARFAKKTSGVTERVSQFGQNDYSEILELVDGLHKIVSGSPALTAELCAGRRAESGSTNDRRLENERDLTLSRAHSMG